jgi:hypothetical protein
MQPLFSNALSKAGENHIKPPDPRRATPGCPALKKLGRRAGSLVALGRSALQTIFAAANPPQISPFLSQLLSPKLPLNSLKSPAH